MSGTDIAYGGPSADGRWGGEKEGERGEGGRRASAGSSAFSAGGVSAGARSSFPMPRCNSYAMSGTDMAFEFYLPMPPVRHVWY
eukprot:2914287-Rhodomonas_salina.1